MARLLVFDGFVFISAVVFIGYLLGLHKFLSKHGENGCEMTYMYEYPQFVRISLAPNVSEEFRRYGLYAYSEGRQTQQVRNMQFTGIPVLFIPGQGGSLRQVRSLASVSLRKALGSDLPFHFDYFTLDLNEEYSALFGGVLPDQTRFASYAVQRIITLYRRQRPDSLVLIGHSMGGMIAKSLFLEPDFPSRVVRLVITLATPHSPVILTDNLLRDYYDRVPPNWAASSNVTVISLGGGIKDLVVTSGLTLTDQADISALTTAVSEVWMPVDHRCILWCKQLVLVLVRALFDSVDPRSLQITRDPQLRLDIFKYHLLERSAGKRYHESVHPAETTLVPSNSEWLELSRPRHSVHRHTLSQPLHLLVHLSAAAVEDTLAVTTSGHKGRDWLFACPQITTNNNGRRVCSTVENLSYLGRIAPTKHRMHKVALVNLRDLRARGLYYVVIRLPPSDEPTSVSYDMFTATERTIPVEVQRWSLPFQWTTLIASTLPDAVFYTLELPQLEKPVQAYHLSVQVVSCSNMTHQAVVSLRVPWSHQHSSVVMRNNQEVTLPLILHTTKPTGDWSVPSPYVTLHLDAKCQYSVFIQSSTVESLAQLVRLYSSQLVAYMAAILLLTVRQQLIALGSRRYCLLFHHALLEGAKPYYVLPAVKIASSILSMRSLPEPLRELLPTPDLATLQGSGLDFLFLPLFLYAVAYALVFLIGLLVYVGIVFSGSTINKFALKFLGKMAGVSRTWTDWLMAAIDKVPCVVSAAMVAIVFSSCGGLAMLVGTVYYFVRVCGMYEDYIEQLFFAPVRYFKNTVMAKWRGQQVPVVDEVIREAEELLSLKSLTEFNFHLTMVMLWGSATVVHLPSVLVWAHNFKYNPVLSPDPATTAALVSSVCAAIIWTLNTPICNHSGEVYKSMANVMFVMACLVLTYCPISLYNLPVLNAVALVFLALHQLWECGCRRWRRGSEPDLVPVSETPPASARQSDDESEEEEEGENPAIKPSPEPDEEDEEEDEEEEEEEDEEEEESSDAEDDKGTLESLEKNRSENLSQKHSPTSASDISMSSYEAISINDLKPNEKQKGNQVGNIESSVLNRRESSDREDSQEEDVDEDDEEADEEEDEEDEQDNKDEDKVYSKDKPDDTKQQDTSRKGYQKESDSTEPTRLKRKQGKTDNDDEKFC